MGNNLVDMKVDGAGKASMTLLEYKKDGRKKINMSNRTSKRISPQFEHQTSLPVKPDG